MLLKKCWKVCCFAFCKFFFIYKMLIILDEEENEEHDESEKVDPKEASNLIRMYIEDAKYAEAFLIVKDIAVRDQQWVKLQ